MATSRANNIKSASITHLWQEHILSQAFSLPFWQPSQSHGNLPEVCFVGAALLQQLLTVRLARRQRCNSCVLRASRRQFYRLKSHSYLALGFIVDHCQEKSSRSDRCTCIKDFLKNILLKEIEFIAARVLFLSPDPDTKRYQLVKQMTCLRRADHIYPASCFFSLSCAILTTVFTHFIAGSSI